MWDTQASCQCHDAKQICSVDRRLPWPRKRGRVALEGKHPQSTPDCGLRAPLSNNGRVVESFFQGLSFTFNHSYFGDLEWKGFVWTITSRLKFLPKGGNWIWYICSWGNMPFDILDRDSWYSWWRWLWPHPWGISLSSRRRNSTPRAYIPRSKSSDVWINHSQRSYRLWEPSSWLRRLLIIRKDRNDIIMLCNPSF